MNGTEQLRGFAVDILRNWPYGDVDGGELQVLAVKWGLLSPHEVTGPCSEESCFCAECDADFPATCYRRTDVLKESI